jgi:hypothetical protein
MLAKRGNLCKYIADKKAGLKSGGQYSADVRHGDIPALIPAGMRKCYYIAIKLYYNNE